jgi:hypothetical protein
MKTTLFSERLSQTDRTGGLSSGSKGAVAGLAAD